MSKISHTAGTDKTTFHHNGDFSGYVTVDEVGPKGEQVNFVNIPFRDLEYIVAEKKRRQLIAALDNLDFEWPHEIDKVEKIYVFFKGMGL